MFNKIQSLFKKYKPLPWDEWLSKSIDTPHIDTSNLRAGHLKFGDDISKAIILGKPQMSQEVGNDGSCLIYPTNGFQIEFSNMKFDSIAFFVDKDAFEPKSDKLQYTTVIIDGVEYTKNTDKANVESLLGAPQSSDIDADETILTYQLSRLTVEFELNNLERLKRVNIYLTE